MGKESACNAGDARGAGASPGLGRSPGRGFGNPLEHCGLENAMDRGAWCTSVSPWGCKESETTEVTQEKAVRGPAPQSLDVHGQLSAQT